jgi:type I restriction enzyme R subunit
MEGTLSIVKHAAVGDPLLSAEERVNQAMARVRAGKTFTPEQERWLGLIRNHLIENLIVTGTTFAFTRVGATWGRVNREFAGPLDTIIGREASALALF